MNKFRNTVIVLACGVAAVAAAQGSTKAVLTGLYAKMDALTLKKDISGLKKLMTATTTKDAVFIEEKGQKKTLKETMDMMDQQLKTMIDKVTKSTSHIDSLVEKGGTATVTVSSVLGFSAQGHKVVVDSKNIDIWVKSAGGWKMKSSKIISQSGTVDGKAIPKGGGV